MASSGTDNDNYVYTRAQLKQKVAEQQIAIQSAQIDQKKAQIEYDAAAEKQEKGQELAKIDGVVTKVAASVESLEKNEPYLVVQGSGGVMVQGTVSEMNLDKLTVGATVTVNSWDTGEMLTAEVTEDIAPLAQYNIDKVLEIADHMVELCAEPVIFEELLKKLFDDYGLTLTFEQYVLVGSTVKSYLAWLKDTGRLTALFEDNRLLWRRA